MSLLAHGHMGQFAQNACIGHSGSDREPMLTCSAGGEDSALQACLMNTQVCTGGTKQRCINVQ
jgi:hypothetical protein